MSNRKIGGTKKVKQKVEIIESVGSGTKLTPKQIESMNKQASDQSFLTYLIKYGSFIGLALFSIGSLIQLYIIN